MTLYRGPEFKGGDWYGDWRSIVYGFEGQQRAEAIGPTQLTAGMRAWAISRLGEVVDVPDEIVSAAAS